MKCVVLDAEAISDFDSTAAEALENLDADLERGDVQLWIARANGPLRNLLQVTGLTDRIGRNNIYPSVRGLSQRITSVLARNSGTSETLVLAETACREWNRNPVWPVSYPDKKTGYRIIPGLGLPESKTARISWRSWISGAEQDLNLKSSGCDRKSHNRFELPPRSRLLHPASTHTGF